MKLRSSAHSSGLPNKQCITVIKYNVKNISHYKLSISLHQQYLPSDTEESLNSLANESNCVCILV